MKENKTFSKGKVTEQWKLNDLQYSLTHWFLYSWNTRIKSLIDFLIDFLLSNIK